MTGDDKRASVAGGRLSAGSLSLLAFTLLLAVVGGVIIVTSPKHPVTSAGPLPVFDLQGHRGARGLHPENSLAGFEAALGLGVTTLEMDLGMTRDGVLVVHHDRRLATDRTRDQAGQWLAEPAPALIDLTFAQLQTYELGRLKPDSKLAERFPEQRGLDGVRVPSLEEVLQFAEERSGGRIRYNLETKLSPLSPEDSPDARVMAEALVALLDRFALEGRAAVQSFDWRTLAMLRAARPEVPTVHLTAEQSWLDNLERNRPGASPWLDGLDLTAPAVSVPQAIQERGGAVWSPYFRDLRPAELREAQRLGLKVVVWTVNDPADMASLIELGVDGIITDYPDRLRRVMAEEGMDLPPAYPSPAD
jgi:glycerophosphoryl diester phosphodiesterase